MKKIKLVFTRFINSLLRKKPTQVEMVQFQSSDKAVEGIKPRYKIDY